MASEDALLLQNMRGGYNSSQVLLDDPVSFSDVESEESLKDLRDQYDGLRSSSVMEDPLVVDDPVAVESDSGFFNQLSGSLERTVMVDNPRLGGKAVEGLGRVFGSDAMRDFGQKIASDFDDSDDPASFVPRVGSIYDAEGIQDYLDYTGSALGQGIGSIGAMAAGGVAGAAAGAAFGAAVPMAAVGATAAGFLLNYGDVYDTLIEEEGLDPDSAAYYGLAPASVMAAVDVYGFGKLLKPARDNLSKNLIKRTAQLAIRGGVTEAVTEVSQQLIQEASGEIAEFSGLATKDIKFDQRVENVANALVGAFFPGTAFGGVSAPFNRPTDPTSDRSSVDAAPAVPDAADAVSDVAKLPETSKGPVRVTAALTGVQDARPDLSKMKDMYLELSNEIADTESKKQDASALKLDLESLEAAIFGDFESSLLDILGRDGDIEVERIDRGIGGWAGQELEPNLRVELVGDEATILRRLTEFNATSGMSGPDVVPQGGALNRVFVEALLDEPDVISSYDPNNVEQNKQFVWDDNGAERLATLRIQLPPEMVTPQFLASVGDVFAQDFLGFTVDRENNTIELIHTPEWSGADAQKTLTHFVDAARSLQKIATDSFGKDINVEWLKERIEISEPASDVKTIKNAFTGGESAYKIKGYQELLKDEYREKDRSDIRDGASIAGRDSESARKDQVKPEARKRGVSVEATDDAASEAEALNRSVSSLVETSPDDLSPSLASVSDSYTPPRKDWTGDVFNEQVGLGDLTPEGAIDAMRGIKSGTELAEFIAKNADNPVHRRIAERIMPHLGDTDVHVLTGKSEDLPQFLIDADAKGTLDTQVHNSIALLAAHESHLRYLLKGLNWSPEGDAFNDVFLRGVVSHSGATAETALHELVHAATVRRLHDGNLLANKGTKLQAASSAIIDLRNKVVDVATKAIESGKFDPELKELLIKATQDQKEFVAYGLTDKKFQDYLMTIKVGNKSAWNTFVEKVANLLGISKNDQNALSELLRATDELLDAPLGTLSARPKTELISRMGGPIKRLGKADEAKPAAAKTDTDARLPDTPDEINKAFNELAAHQRYLPEEAMLDLTRLTGGVGFFYADLAEHIGDLTHRMSENGGGMLFAMPKIERYHRRLHNPYGFEKEMLEGVESNFNSAKKRAADGRADDWTLQGAKYESLDDAMAHLKSLGQTYADEHRKLPVYNEVQRLGNDAAIAVGEFRFDDAREILTTLKKYADEGDDAFKARQLRVEPEFARFGSPPDNIAAVSRELGVDSFVATAAAKPPAASDIDVKQASEALESIRDVMDDLDIFESDPLVQESLKKIVGTTDLDSLDEFQQATLLDGLMSGKVKKSKVKAPDQVTRGQLTKLKKRYKSSSHSGAPEPLTRKNKSKKKYKHKGVPKSTMTSNASIAFLGAEAHTSLLDGRNPIDSDSDWDQWWGGITGTKQVLDPPYKIRSYTDPEKIAVELRKLTPDQKRKADEGIDLVESIGEFYKSGNVTAQTTAKLLAWSILSRSLSAFPHESAFLDAYISQPTSEMFTQDLDSFIQLAVDGKFDETAMEEYDVWIGGHHRRRACSRWLKDGLITESEYTMFVGQDRGTVESLLSRGVIDEKQSKEFLIDLDTDKGKDSLSTNRLFAERLRKDGQITNEEFALLVGIHPALKIEGMGNPAAANLRSFGQSFLKKSNEKVPEGQTLVGLGGKEFDFVGQTKLQAWHSILVDQSITGKEARRLYHQLYQGSGIDNKVISFQLLVAGRTDVIVIDRIQANHFWDAAGGSLGNKVLYEDGTKIDLYEGFSKPTTGNSWNLWSKNPRPYSTSRGLADILNGVRGAILYEAIESSLLRNLDEGYSLAGREGDGSIGRFHWESWVINSGQEVGHDTLNVVLKELRGESDPAVGAFVSEGKFQQRRYGMKYVVLPGNDTAMVVATQDGQNYLFDRRQWSKVIDKLKKDGSNVKTGDFPRIVPKGWSLQNERFENTAWYNRASVNRDNLDIVIREYGTPSTNEQDAAIQRFADRARVDGSPGSEEQGNPLGPISRYGSETGNPLGGDYEPIKQDMSNYVTQPKEVVVDSSDIPELELQSQMIVAEYSSLPAEDKAGKRGALLSEWYKDVSQQLSSASFADSDTEYERFLTRRGSALSDRGLGSEAEEMSQRYKLSETISMGSPLVDLYGASGKLNRLLFSMASNQNLPVSSSQVTTSDRLSLIKDPENIERLKRSGLITYVLYRDLLGDTYGTQ